MPSLLADAAQTAPEIAPRRPLFSTHSQKSEDRLANTVATLSPAKPPGSSRIFGESALFVPLSEFSVNTPHLGTAAALRSPDDLSVPIRNALNFLQRIPELPCSAYRGPVLPVQSRIDSPITLILDLDETLAHCSRASSCKNNEPPDVVVCFEDQPSQGNVHFRPFAKTFLEVVARSFEVVVFTASQQSYADKVLDVLDPNGTTIHHRLYRPQCTEHRGAYFKELGLLGRPLSRCVIVDNSPISCACNADNSILCKSWYGDAHDRELLDLLGVLEELQKSPNLPRYLASRYGLFDFFSALRQGMQAPGLHPSHAR